MLKTFAAAAIATSIATAAMPEAWTLYQGKEEGGWSTRLIEAHDGTMLCSAGVISKEDGTAFFLFATAEEMSISLKHPAYHYQPKGKTQLRVWIDGNRLWKVNMDHGGGGLYASTIGKGASKFLAEFREGSFLYTDFDGDLVGDSILSLKYFQSAYLEFVECVRNLGGEVPTQTGGELVGEKL